VYAKFEVSSAIGSALEKIFKNVQKPQTIAKIWHYDLILRANSSRYDKMLLDQKYG